MASDCRNLTLRSSAVRLGQIAAVLMMTVFPTMAANIGYVVDPGAQIDEVFDIFWTDRLESQGHTVTPIGADEPADSFPDADMFIISNDVASGDVLAGFGVDDPRPMISSGEWGLNDDWGLSTDGSGQNFEEMTITIPDPTHPLAAGLSGDVDVFTNLQQMSFMLGDLSPDLTVVATVDDLPAIAVLEEGGRTSATGLDDISPGLRIFLFSRTEERGDRFTDEGLSILDTSVAYALGLNGNVPPLQAGDANQDLKFDQLDLVQVQIAAKYLTNQPATWGDGDWNGAPGGAQGSPPPGDGLFNQGDIVAALSAGKYLTGPYAAIAQGGTVGDAQMSREDFVAGDLTVVGSLAGGGASGNVDLVSIPVPEPETLVLLGFGLVGLLRFGRRAT